MRKSRGAGTDTNIYGHGPLSLLVRPSDGHAHDRGATETPTGLTARGTWEAAKQVGAGERGGKGQGQQH